RRGATTAAVALVGPDGAVTPIPTDHPSLDFDDPPRAVAVGEGAVVLGCASSPGTVTIVDASQGVVTTSSEAPFACNFTNQLASSMLGRALDPAQFTAASGQELGVYAYEGARLQRLQTFASTGGVHAWVEQIEPGVVATLSWRNSADDPSGRWTYHRTDTGAGPSLAPRDVMLDPYDARGLPRVRREPDGALLVSTGHVGNAGCSGCLGLFRWHVEGDGRVERLAELPPAPFGEWVMTGFGRAVATELGPNPEWPGLTTPTRSASLSVRDGAYEVALVRGSPCSDEGHCRRFGETYTPAVVGSGDARLAIQALWTWAGPTVVVAAPAGGDGAPGGGIVDGGATPPDAEAPDAGAPDAQAPDAQAPDAATSTWNAQLIASGFPGARFVGATSGLAVFTTDDATSGQVVSVALPDGPVVSTFTGRASPARVAVAGSPPSWWWAETGSGTIMTSGQGTPLNKYNGEAQPFGVVLDGTSTYWTNLGGTGAVRGAGPSGAPFTIATNEGAPSTLVSDATHLYWIGASGTQVRRWPKAGGSATTLVTEAGAISALAVAGGTLYFASADGWLKRCPVDGCASPSAVVGGLGAVVDLAADATGAFFTAAGQAPGEASVRHVPAGSASAVELARGATAPGGITVTSSLVLWVTSAGELWRVGKP
ncbi:MAG: hypothetical protein IT374_03785, partial [Polyangiaceae bacterium]|nr:hypothetical protein [Polyangiaceae bacterium]